MTSRIAAARTLTPIALIVFLEFLAMGLPLAVLPQHVQHTLGFGSLTIAIVIGSQSWATLATRHAAGTRSDRDGPSSATRLGLLLSGMAGLAYLASTVTVLPALSLTVLLVGRALLGIGESLVITGALSWGVALVGRERAGVVMSWVGVAMYAALAAGAPLGASLTTSHGVASMSVAAGLAPLAALLVVVQIRPAAPIGGIRLPFYRVLRSIALPGAGLMLSAVSFGAIATFSTLRFAAASWAHASLTMSAFGAAYVLARLLFGGLPDRFGGARIATGCAFVAALGQVGLWLAPTATWALAAAALTGFGFSLAFPAFGVEAVRRVPPQNRGVALGAFAACFDLSLGLGVPLLGLTAGHYGYAAPFAAGAVAALLALGIALLLSIRPTRTR